MVTPSPQVEHASQILLQDAVDAIRQQDWQRLALRSRMLQTLDPGNEDAARFARLAKVALDAHHRGQAARPAPPRCGDGEMHRHPADPQDVVDRALDMIPFSAVATRVINLLNDESSSADEIATLAATDPVLSAKILRVANSAMYRRRGRVPTVREALVVLGAREVRSIAVTACLIDTMQQPSNYIDRDAFWRFSLIVGLLSDLAARMDRRLRGDAFTAGVLHNIGLLALDYYCSSCLRRAVETDIPGRLRLRDRELDVFGFTDDDVGARLAEAWNLPDSIVQAIASHGLRPDELPDDDPLAGYVIEARVLARCHGLSDGAESSPPRPLRGFWTMRPQRIALEQLGGVDGLLARVASLQQTAIEP